MARRKVASPGHKLGQLVGTVLQRALADPLRACAERHGCYCDGGGQRPGVRSGKKVTWVDASGNTHDLDFVFERGGGKTEPGTPVAFIEVAWRRYTKHSRNKAGELLGALLPLRETYPSTRFLGAILAGEFTPGGIKQLESAGVNVLHVDFETIRTCFESAGVVIEYPEKASIRRKRALSRSLESAAAGNLEGISALLRRAIAKDYAQFEQRLDSALARRVTKIRVLCLFGQARVFHCVEDALEFLSSPLATTLPEDDAQHQGYEVFVEFSTGTEIRARFATRDEARDFLRKVV